MFKKIKDFMDQPYTKGDYYGAIAILLAIYAAFGAWYVAYTKVKAWKRKKKTEDDDLCPYIDPEDEEA